MRVLVRTDPYGACGESEVWFEQMPRVGDLIALGGARFEVACVVWTPGAGRAAVIETGPPLAVGWSDPAARPASAMISRESASRFVQAALWA